MKITLVTKNFGNQTINADSFNPLFVSPSTPIFKAVEYIWEKWFEESTENGAPMSKDIKGMYFGESDQPAVYTKRGAICQAIEDMINLCIETKQTIVNTRQLLNMDLEAAFY